MARLTKAQRSDIQKSLRQGVGISELARQHSVSRPTIRNIRDQMGIVPESSGLSEVQAFRVNPAEQAALERLVKAGTPQGRVTRFQIGSLKLSKDQGK